MKKAPKHIVVFLDVMSVLYNIYMVFSLKAFRNLTSEAAFSSAKISFEETYEVR